jgi:hypothetical protein
VDKYLHEWVDRADVIRDFAAEEIEDFPTDEEIIIADYTYEDYSGAAFVLYEQDGKLFEVNGSHCSCHGLEGQWDPEETSIGALKLRKWTDEEVASVIDRLARR